MKLNMLLTNFALASAMSLTALPGFATDATSGSGTKADPQAPASGEMAPPAGSGEIGPSTPGAVPNAMGAETPGSSSPIDFGALDSNKDGSVTMGEYLKYGGTSESFRQSDKNSDNKLDSSELMTQ